jgi:hypothetical protein
MTKFDWSLLCSFDYKISFPMKMIFFYCREKYGVVVVNAAIGNLTLISVAKIYNFKNCN